MELLFKTATINGAQVAPEFNTFKREIMKPKHKGDEKHK